MLRVLSYLKRYKWRAITGVVMKALSTVTDLALPLMLAYIVDNALPTEDIPLILKLSGLMLLISLFGVVTGIKANQSGARVSQDLAKDIRSDMFANMQTFSFKELDEFTTPSLITRITTDAYNIQHMVMMMLRMAIRAPMLFFGGMIMALALDPVLTLVLVFCTPILVGIVYLNFKYTIPIYRKLQVAVDKMITVLRENLSGIRVIRALTMAGKEKKRFEEKNEKVFDLETAAGKLMAIINPSMMLVMNLGLAAALWFGGVRVNIGGMKAGDMIAFVNYFTMILQSLLAITRIFISYSRAAASAQRIVEVLDAKTDIIDGTINHSETKPGTPVVEFKNVSFRYPGSEEDVLEDISFKLMPGDQMAIIGGTGSGKTTIANLIMRFYDIRRGDILVNGIPVKNYTLKALREEIALVLQSTSLFSDTIVGNIKWGNPDASDEDLERAIRVSQAEEFLTDGTREGQDTVLSQGGTNLSGGQRQRVSIARALVKKGGLLILDDSSSALDYATDARLRGALKKEYSELTTIIIAQRISSVQHADQILVLHSGQEVGLGTHDELLRDCEIYREIYDSQIGGDDYAS